MPQPLGVLDSQGVAPDLEPTLVSLTEARAKTPGSFNAVTSALISRVTT